MAARDSASSLRALVRRIRTEASSAPEAIRESVPAELVPFAELKERHGWVVHGVMRGASAEKVYARLVSLLRKVKAAPARDRDDRWLDDFAGAHQTFAGHRASLKPLFHADKWTELNDLFETIAPNPGRNHDKDIGRLVAVLEMAPAPPKPKPGGT